jgi:hypothetical protein
MFFAHGEMRDWVEVGESQCWGDAVGGVYGSQCMLYSVNVELSVCCTRCMLYLVYAVLGVNSESWHGEIEMDDLTSCSQLMVELRMSKREMRGEWTNDHERLGLKRMLFATQFTIPNTRGTSHYPASNYTHSSSSLPNQASPRPDLSCPLVSSPSFSCSSPSLSFLSTTVPSSQNTKSTHLLLSHHVMIVS